MLFSELRVHSVDIKIPYKKIKEKQKKYKNKQTTTYRLLIELHDPTPSTKIN